jgi:hypothetical protein
MKSTYKIGDKVWRLTIIDKVLRTTPSGRRRSNYACLCECGNPKVVYAEGYNLKNGRFKSCGCLRKRANGLSNTIEYRMWKSAKDRSEEKGWEFNIELSDIEIPEICPLLQIPLIKHSTRERHYDASSLDRIDSTKGYTKDNIWVISHRANQIKNDATVEELEKITNNLKKFLQEKLL